MFRPSKSVTRCPICGEPLTYEDAMIFIDCEA